MKTISKLLVLTIVIASISSCKKDDASYFPGQKPYFSYRPEAPERAVIEVRNECLNYADKISYVLLSASDTTGITHSIEINRKLEFTSGIIGENELTVVVENSGTNNITVTDSEGVQYYQSIITPGTYYGRFHKINVSGKNKVIVTYR